MGRVISEERSLDFSEVIKAGKTPKPVLLTLLINWGIKPFTMYFIATFFLGYVFKNFLPGTEVLKDGSTVELFRSYISGTILLGIAPCTAMVLMWGYLSKGKSGHFNNNAVRHDAMTGVRATQKTGVI